MSIIVRIFQSPKMHVGSLSSRQKGRSSSAPGPKTFADWRGWPLGVPARTGLAARAILLGSMLCCGTVLASTPIVESLSLGLQDAGCSYSVGENRPAIFVVDARSRPNHRKSVARVKIDGVERELDWVSPEGARSPIYARGAYAVQLSNFVDDLSACNSGECEGTVSTVTLTVRAPTGEAVFVVRAHCGA